MNYYKPNSFLKNEDFYLLYINTKALNVSKVFLNVPFGVILYKCPLVEILLMCDDQMSHIKK